MNEDISAHYRAAATFLMLSMLVSSILMVSTVGMSLWNEWEYRQNVSVNSLTTTTALQLNMEGKVNALVAYKFLEANTNLFGDGDIIVKFSDGTSTSDYRQLLRKGECEFEIEIQKKRNGFYKAVLEEV